MTGRGWGEETWQFEPQLSVVGFETLPRSLAPAGIKVSALLSSQGDCAAPGEVHVNIWKTIEHAVHE